MKNHHTFTLTNEREIEHFKKWREMYDPPGIFKLFGCKTMVYLDEEDGNSYYKTIVTTYIKDEVDAPKPAKEVPGVPEDEGPDPLS